MEYSVEYLGELPVASLVESSAESLEVLPAIDLVVVPAESLAESLVVLDLGYRMREHHLLEYR